jgi:putative peptidoglycan lipid II flippase
VWLLAASVLSGGVTWGISYGWQQFVPVANKITLLLQLVLAGGTGAGVFFAIASQLKLPEFDRFVTQIRQKIFKK